MSRDLLENTRLLGENEAKLAALRGHLHGAVTAEIANDQVHRENIRALAWLRHDPSLALTPRGECVVGMPDGWPPTVQDPEEHLSQDLAQRRDAHIERLFGSPGTALTRADDSPATRDVDRALGL